MNATLVIEHRFKKDAKGKIYASSNSINTLLWERYLEVFDHLTVVARIQDISNAEGENYLVTHEKVDFVTIPYYVGPKQFIRNYFKIKKILEAQVHHNQAYICRLPSILGAIIVKDLKRKNIPYIIELVGDPWEVFAPGSWKNSLAFFHRYRSYFSLKKNVKRASGVIYVTKNTLQKRYPSNKNAISTHASNVILRAESITNKAKRFSHKVDKLKMTSIGSLEQMYKSPDIVLKALGEVKKKGIEFELIWLGDGVHKEAMQKLAKKLGISEHIKFKGNVVTSEVLEVLHNSNLFIHVSRTEGLPRALIEAMAQGLPCIGTKVGGIPELLQKECLIEKNDIDALVQMITFFYENPDFMQKMAEMNLNKAMEYEFSELATRRSKVYKHLENIVK